VADRPDATREALAAYEARLRSWAEAAQRTARRNVNLITPANRVQLLLREAVLRLAGWPLLAPLIKRLLNREGERLGSS
jgi:2-polyprenyl-6-methoxyphenol hydroxylase-like FAD-dependent oxidoreductase